MEHLCQLIRNNRGLRHLNLAMVTSGLNGINDVLEVISEFCPRIEILNLNDIDPLNIRGVKHLSSCTNLRELDIGKW